MLYLFQHVRRKVTVAWVERVTNSPAAWVWGFSIVPQCGWLVNAEAYWNSSLGYIQKWTSCLENKETKQNMKARRRSVATIVALFSDLLLLLFAKLWCFVLCVFFFCFLDNAVGATIVTLSLCSIFGLFTSFSCFSRTKELWYTGCLDGLLYVYSCTLGYTEIFLFEWWISNDAWLLKRWL